MTEPAITIHDLIREAGRQLRSDFESIKATNPHFAERGAEAEQIVRDFLNAHLPKRFAADTGLVIDDEGGISRQCDIIVYDASNSPIYRRGSRVLILPSDNVAAVMEVKSTLSKTELEDGATKIASVKALKRSPLSEVDQPVTMSPMIMTRCLGVVFAYGAGTSLDALAENLREINRGYPSDQWVDLVVVLDKGVVGYTVQMMFSPIFTGWHGGPADERFMVPPYYVHLVAEEHGELTLNRFFVTLMGHLVFYRRRTSIRFDAVLGAAPRMAKTFEGYQYSLSRQLVPADEYHQEGKFHGAKVRFNLRNTKEDRLVAQIGWIPWQDGAVISYSGQLPPQLFFQAYFDAAKTNGGIMAVPDSARFLSSVIPLSAEAFIEATESFGGDFAPERCTEGDEDLGWFPKREHASH